MLLLCLQGRHLSLPYNVHIFTFQLQLSCSYTLLNSVFIFNLLPKKETLLESNCQFYLNHRALGYCQFSKFNKVLICYISCFILSIGNLKQTNQFIEKIKANIFK